MGRLDAHVESTDLSYGMATTQRGFNGGTWAHPKLAVFFARWLDVRFAVWCDMQIDKRLRGEVVAPAGPEMARGNR
jgi:hypothetical protein